MASSAQEEPPEGNYRDHIGVNAQRQPGLNFVGFSIVSGRISTAQLKRIASLAQRYGDGTLRLSATQNILVLNVPDANIEALVAAADLSGVSVGGSSPFQRGTLSCTGREYCKLALTETKHFSIHLAAELEDRLPGFTQAIKLHVAGCPNACGQQWIADVGLQGVLIKQGGGAEVEGFDVFVGGGLGVGSAISRRVGFRATSEDVPDALERLFRQYDSSREPGEIFRSWATRVGDKGVQAILSDARGVGGSLVTA